MTSNYSELHHPNVVRLLGLYHDKKTEESYMVMEYVSKYVFIFPPKYIFLFPAKKSYKYEYHSFFNLYRNFFPAKFSCSI